ncbi:Aste57867_3026 [Aphanomyces stellatus]|uniref:Aste57867_3026 protein n=1 Tax=Aphanomyces stellatus TaxID=120398 RepID=A0A485K8V3_9STRA|nr:hypothetical protein As57867_003017 [Aphanomyces stellatus]VFT80206.1 Aste57867_3026 [Aphanomyces stellatus]
MDNTPHPFLSSEIHRFDDATSFFAFLQATDARGPLESLWQLGLSLPHDSLYPSLSLTEAMLIDPIQLAHVESVLPWYAHINVFWLHDLDWLYEHLGRLATVAWQADFPLSHDDAIVRRRAPGLPTWFHLWAQLPITKLVVRDHNGVKTVLTKQTAQYLYETLPRCHHLKAVDFSGACDVSAIFKWAATSTTLVDLGLHFRSFPNLTPTQLTHATQWLTTAPVERIYLSAVNWDPNLNPAVRNAFFIALFTCPTMQSVALRAMDAPMLDAVTLSMAVPEVHLIEMTVSLAGLRTLAHAIRHSTRLTSVYIHDLTFHDKNTDTEFEELLQAVAASKEVTTFEAIKCRLGDSFWPRLGPILQTTHLETIALSRNAISDKGATWIGHAIQASTTLSKVILDWNDISVDGVLGLLDSCAHRQPSFSLSVVGVPRHSDSEQALLRTHAQERRVDLTV